MFLFSFLAKVFFLSGNTNVVLPKCWYILNLCTVFHGLFFFLPHSSSLPPSACLLSVRIRWRLATVLSNQNHPSSDKDIIKALLWKPPICAFRLNLYNCSQVKNWSGMVGKNKQWPKLFSLSLPLQSHSDSKPGGRCNMPQSTADDQPHIGCYRLLKTIGKGNFAKVKLAKHVLTGKEVRIAFTPPNKECHKANRRLFKWQVICLISGMCWSHLSDFHNADDYKHAAQLLAEV